MLRQFEKVVVVSTGQSWRIEGLAEAAKLSGIELEIPSQRQWTTDEVDRFRRYQASGGKDTIGPGQAQCWLGHLNVLHAALARKWATVLVMEDDVDWDIAIKEQLEKLAPLIRSVSEAAWPLVDGGSLSSRHASPYGDVWDVLWLGHCGDNVPATGVLSLIDETLPTTALYRETYGDYSYFPPQLRMIYATHSPLCTYSYAVTASAAMKIYQRARGGMDRIITTELREWCQRGVLRCVTVNPELFHHHKKAGQPSSQVAAVEGWAELAAPEKVDFTANIRYSARCNTASKELVSCQSEFRGPEEIVGKLKET